MSYGDLGIPKTFIAAADYSAEAKQYTLVKRGATAGEAETAGAGEKVAGVQWNRPEAGEAMEVIVASASQPHVVAGAAFANGVELAADANGNAVAAVATDYVFGIARVAAGGAGEYVMIDFLGEAQYVKA